MQYAILLLPVLVLTSLFAPASAQTPASTYFEAGTRSFKQQNYRDALHQFKRAEEEGMRDARLDYNLGSVYYRLGEYDSSRLHFEKLLDHPDLSAQAYYSLALIEHKLGRDRAAINLFESSAEVATDPKIQRLARKQINTLTTQLVKNWYAYVATFYGYDSNITSLPSSAGSDESGDFTQILALAGWEPWARGQHSVNTSILYLSRDFVDDDDFDDDSLTLDVDHLYRFEDWELQYGLEVSQSTFANDDYLSTTGLLLKARHRLTENGELRLDFKHEDISSRSSEFDYLDGSLTLFRAEYRTETGPWEYRYTVEQEFNDRRNTAEESFSPARNRVGVRVFHALSDETTLGGLVDYRVSDYLEVPSQDRKDDRIRIRLEAEHRLDSTWSVQGETTYLDNDSSEDISDYYKYEVMLSINAVF